MATPEQKSYLVNLMVKSFVDLDKLALVEAMRGVRNDRFRLSSAWLVAEIAQSAPPAERDHQVAVVMHWATGMLAVATLSGCVEDLEQELRSRIEGECVGTKMRALLVLSAITADEDPTNGIFH